MARLHWARPFLPVPDVIDTGEEDGVGWLVTLGIEGVPATEASLGDARAVVIALAEGLRRIHDCAPVDRCPFDFRLDAAFDHVRRRIATGIVDPVEDFHPEHRHLDVPAAWAALERHRPGREDLVVCHGDYCAPNILLSGGEAVAYVDIGELGVADRWWDLAVATWSVTWNFGPGHEALFLTRYGARPDPARQAFYRLLYDLAS